MRYESCRSKTTLSLLFWAKLVGNPGALVLLLAVPAVIFFIVLAGLGHLNLESIRNEAGKIAYSSLIKSYFIDGVFVPIFFFAVVSLAIGVTQILERHDKGNRRQTESQYRKRNN